MQKQTLFFIGGGLLLILAALLPWPTPHAISPQTTPIPTHTVAERGANLFMAKGCSTCHLHAEITEQSRTFSVGPDLTHYQNDADFVRDWLRNPQAIRPATQMPNLQLKESEIEVLVVFLLQ